MGGVGGVGGVGGNYGYGLPEPATKRALDEIGKLFEEAVKHHTQTGKWNLMELSDLKNRLEALENDPNLSEDQINGVKSALSGLNNLIENNKKEYDIKKQMDELIKQGKEDSPEFAELQNQLSSIKHELIGTQMILQMTMTQLCNLPVEPLPPPTPF